MDRKIVAFGLLVVMGIAPVAQAEDAASILKTMQQKQLERMVGVDDYLVEQSVMGNAASMYFQRTQVTDSQGEAQTFFLPISQNQRTSGSCSTGAVLMTPEELAAYAPGAQKMVAAGSGDAMKSGPLAGMGSGSTPTMGSQMMTGGGTMLAQVVADAQQHQAQEGERNKASARESADQMTQFMETARLIGTETIDGKPAYHLKSDSLQVQQGDAGETYTMEVMSLWIDKKYYVPVRMKVDGTMTSKGETRPITIESVMTDYRTVPGSSMYESYKQTMKIAGMMTAEQEAEMAEAAARMADYEKQMAEMPASQRKMMEKMMGPQIEAMRSMSSDGGFQTEKVVRSIQVNPPMVAADGRPCSSATTMAVAVEKQEAAATTAASAGIKDRGMVEMIQTDLGALGYEPGPVTGELTTATAIAISKFQAQNNMEVTGEPSPQLAGVLSARASGAAPAAPVTPVKAPVKGAAKAAPATDPAALKAAQQACLDKKVADAQAAQKTKRGFGRLVSGISRVASKYTGGSLASDIAQTRSDVYTANATAEDFAAAAKDLGLTEEDVAACQHPG